MISTPPQPSPRGSHALRLELKQNKKRLRFHFYVAALVQTASSRQNPKGTFADAVRRSSLCRERTPRTAPPPLAQRPLHQRRLEVFFCFFYAWLRRFRAEERTDFHLYQLTYASWYFLGAKIFWRISSSFFFFAFSIF